ncbi:PAS domain-containing sensor histidine kinase [Lysobacter sp. GX 14042]|uniref:PAS domain-containing sensor histidine kinase n=1 Tax=Lysobacter sp. GX 14042 TaxID=2907155 RepID=UPI001F3BBAFF|nr:PAS domain-containing sensor histidine kinase [Lysobacter sp. GX 14042]MCE7032557.1 PAS domain-containing sensor histidine kinase [Lysobacter sp. GX 14042]
MDAAAAALPATIADADFRLLVESVRDYAILLLDARGHITSWNLGAQLTKGYLAGEIIGRHFSVFYTPEDVDRGWPAQELEMALRDGRFEDEGWRLRKDGSRFWASVVITALFDGQGRHYGFGKVTRDMTAHRRVSKLESQERHLHQFLAVLGHELRNPLAPIANAVQIMGMQELSAPLRATRDILDRQVGHLSRLVDDLLDVGRIVSGKVHLRREPLDLREVVSDAVETVTPAIQARRHVLQVDVPDGPVRVDGDKVRLVQVLNNLLGNAAKFTPEGGRMKLLLNARDGVAQLCVSDNGPGIPAAEQEHVFKLFTQSSSSSDRHYGGLGVGLSMVHQLAELHGGSVSAFSTGEPGKGAEFVVELPLLDDEPA